MKQLTAHTLHMIMNPNQAALEEKVGEGVPFERIRRVTGYLSGDIRRFNNAKRAEVKDRVKHTMEETDGQKF